MATVRQLRLTLKHYAPMSIAALLLTLTCMLNAAAWVSVDAFVLAGLSLPKTLPSDTYFQSIAMSASFTSQRCPAVSSTMVLTMAAGTDLTFADGMVDWPDDVTKYSQVPKPVGTYFEHDSIPKGLLMDHTTKEGTWGIIRVNRGTLEYTIQEPIPRSIELTSDVLGIIEPQVKHHVRALSDDVQFVVEFYRRPGTGPVDEKREGL